MDSNKLSGCLDILSKAVIGALASVYATGVFVVSLHQSRYGLASISLVRTQYILAGLWVLAPLLALVTITAWVGSTVHDVLRKPKAVGRTGLRRWAGLVGRLLRAVFWAAISLSLGAFLFRFGARYLTGREWSFGVRTVVEVIANLISFALLIGFSGFGSWLYLRDVKLSALSKSANDLLWGITFVSSTIILIIAYLAYFTFHWYDRIPASIGGGAPIRVQFVVSDTASQSSSVLLLNADRQLSIRYWLLLSTEKSLIVTDPLRKNEAIELDRSAVKAVIYIPF